MREILFREKQTNTNLWRYGYYSVSKNGTHLITWADETYNRSAAVIPETVGQFTGILDKNGNKIFEGDILKYNVCNTIYESAICFKNGSFEVNENNKDGNLPLSYFVREFKQIKVIGNIHDNPELLK